MEEITFVRVSVFTGCLAAWNNFNCLRDFFCATLLPANGCCAWSLPDGYTFSLTSSMLVQCVPQHIPPLALCCFHLSVAL